ncbi:hypothetical protein KKB99_06145 [bacterium]|nr:hypothetical protein [bacterium]MBU1025568.1 hypothetical protein [bacterium]
MLIALLMLASAVSAEDDSSTEKKTNPDTGHSVVPVKRDEKNPPKDEKEKSEDREQTTDDVQKEIKSIFPQENLLDMIETQPGETSARDLNEIFEQTKKMGSLEEVLKTRGDHNPRGSEDFMGPLSGDQIKKNPAHDYIGPPPPPINTENMDQWNFVGPPLPEPEEGEEIDEEEDSDDELAPQPEIEFEDIEPPEDRKYADLSADKITRDKLKHTVLLEGNAKVVYEDVIILSEFCEFNDDEEWGKFWGATGVLAESDDGISRSERLEAFFKDKKAYFHENVEIFVFGREYEDELDEDAPKKDRIKRALGKDDTTITCDEVEYDWGDKTFYAHVDDSERVKVTQDGRYAYAKALYHERETELTIMQGDVELWQEKGDWLFDRDVVKDKEGKWANALLRPETTITCDSLESRGEEEKTTLDGDVLAVQKGKRASADKVTNDDIEKIFIADGNVKAHHDDGDWLIENKIVDPEEESEETLEDLKKAADGEADILTIWTEKEDMEAEGNVHVWQEHQEASTDKAVYTKKLDRLQVFGNVKVTRESTKDLFSDKGILWFTTKVYEAFGNVKSKGMIDVDKEREKAQEDNEESTPE